MKKLPKLNKLEIQSLDPLSKFYSRIQYLFEDDSIRYDKKDKLKDYFVAIPISSRCLQTLFQVRKVFKGSTIIPKFLDVGCGYGNVVALAQSLGFDSQGIEIRDTYKSIHNKICCGRVFYTDAFEFNTYSEYDVIYLYCPIKNRVLMEKLLKKIAMEAKKGTFICCFGIGYYGDNHGTKFGLKELENTTSEVWVKE